MCPVAVNCLDEPGAGGLGSPAGEAAWEHDSMDMAVATLNIAHYKQLLVTETDAAKREAIASRLVEEEAKLAKILKERKPI